MLFFEIVGIIALVIALLFSLVKSNSQDIKLEHLDNRIKNLEEANENKDTK